MAGAVGHAGYEVKLMRWLSLVVLIGIAGPAFAQSTDNIVATPSLLMGCRTLVENAPTGDMMQIGACAGAVSAALDISRSQRKVCPPPGGRQRVHLVRGNIRTTHLASLLAGADRSTSTRSRIHGVAWLFTPEHPRQ
jgi:hypothetical protein